MSHIFATVEQGQSADWGTIIGAISLAVSIVVTIILFLLKKKAKVEEDLRISEIKVLEKDISVTQETCTRLEHVLDAMQDELKVRTGSCEGKFVSKEVYSAVTHAQREEMGALREMVTRQADVIEKMR